MFYLIVFINLILLMLAYLHLADHYNIIDKPNERSSHTKITIRGGGIIFVLAIIAWWLTSGLPLPLFFAGFLIISTVSFIDDLGHVPNRLRLTAHLVTVILLLLEVLNSAPMVGVSTIHQIMLVMLILPIVMGFINAYNFMDGINGITVVYSLVTIGTIAFLNHELVFIDPKILTYSMMGLLIFGFFNFRRRAVCFAGDVGAVSMAFIITLLLSLLIVKASNFYYLAFVLVYGVDSVGTIIQRLIQRDNIFDAHRKHLYQLMANESQMPHVIVSLVYGIVQLGINVLFIWAIQRGMDPALVFFSLLIGLVLIFAFVKIRVYNVFAKTG